jgi:hypothetical protein
MTKVAALVLSVSVCALVGCTAPTSNDEDPTGAAAEEELKSADCPAKVEVTLAKPTVMSNDKLVAAWTKDFDVGFGDPKKDAEEQLTTLTPHLSKARSETAVTLEGTLGKACSYATVNAKTGKANGYRLWFAKTGGPKGELQLRITRDLGGPDTLFFNTPVKTLSPTALRLDTTKDARVFAQRNIPEFHGEPGGPNAFIGFADVTAKLTH